jgi:pimeloyl-ACP methyl ester carboxylesterase
VKLDARVCEHNPALHYQVGPSGQPPLLLLHGVTRRGNDWRGLIPQLSSQWRVFALDQRGHGGSGRAASYLVTDYVSDAVHFIRSEIAEPVVMIGHSLGAMVTMAVATEAPELVRAMVLEDPPLHGMGERIHGTPWQAQFKGMQIVARRGGSVEQIADALAEIRLPMPDGTTRRLGDLRSREALLGSAEDLSFMDPEVLTPVIEGRWLDGYELLGKLSRAKCPTLLLQGDPTAGGALTDEEAQLIEQGIDHCQRVQFPGVPHQIHQYQPEAMLRVIGEFFEAQDSAPP